MTVGSPSPSYSFTDLLADLAPAPEGAAPRKWAASLVVDFNAVEHWRPVGRVHPPEEEEIRVELIRRDVFDLAADPVSVVCVATEISMAGLRLDVAACRELGQLLATAADELESLEAEAT